MEFVTSCNLFSLNNLHTWTLHLFGNHVRVSRFAVGLFNPFMHNVVKWPNILQKSCGVNTARFIKFVWPFYNMHERVKTLCAIWHHLYNLKNVKNTLKVVGLKPTTAEAVNRRCFGKKACNFIKNRLQPSCRPATLLKKRL